jgi:4-amino-4-deoxy-L-arabinose transferase-like glycosyltransferase
MNDPAVAPSPNRFARTWERVADLATFALAAAWLARLVPQALAARLQTDECFHAWVSRWVSVHGALPESVPGLYGGFAYFYPPLFHLVGGLAFTFGGGRGFLLVNVAVTALLLFVVARGVRRLEVPGAARWAVALCVATQFLALHSVRLYVEDLSTLLVAAAVLRLLLVLQEPRAGDALALGIASGLAIVAKLSALVLPPALIVIALVAFARGRRAVAGALAAAAAIACAVAAPWLAHNVARFGSPVYPALGRDVHPLLMRLNVAHFTPSPAVLWTDVLRHAGPAVLAFVVGAFVFGAWRRRCGAELALLAGAAVLVLLAPLQSLLEARHLLPLMIASGVIAAVAVGRAVADTPRLRRAVDVTAIGFAAAAVLSLPALRAGADLDESPENLAAFAAVRANVPAGETVLARETYDVLWYADRPADWPVPFGQASPPLGLFLTADPDSIARDLARHRLRWVLLTDDAGPAAFDGGEWPQPTLDGLAKLVGDGRAREVWREEDRALLRVGP